MPETPTPVLVYNRIDADRRKTCLLMTSFVLAILPVVLGSAVFIVPWKAMYAYLQGGFAGIKADLTSAAEAMPEADYGFKPTSMPDVRTFGETILHVASAHFGMCARLRGVADEPRQKIEHTNKADVLKTLAASFSSCDAALSSLTDASANELVRQGPVEIPKSAALVGLLAHDAEMYGITTVYLRARNIVPPSTARQKGNR
jgi:DinB family protein